MCAICWKCFFDVLFCAVSCLFYIDFWIPLTILSQRYEIHIMVICRMHGLCFFSFSSSFYFLVLTQPKSFDLFKHLENVCLWSRAKIGAYIVIIDVLAWNHVRNVSHLYSTLSCYKPLSLLYSHRKKNNTFNKKLPIWETFKWDVHSSKAKQQHINVHSNNKFQRRRNNCFFFSFRFAIISGFLIPSLSICAIKLMALKVNENRNVDFTATEKG